MSGKDISISGLNNTQHEKMTRYKCIECRKEFAYKEKDGLACPSCKGYLNPIGNIEMDPRIIDEWFNEFIQSFDGLQFGPYTLKVVCNDMPPR